MIRGSTAVYGLLGHPVKASHSPQLHNAWFQHFGIDAVYVTFDVPAPGEGLIDAVRTLGLAGANVTVPHKTHIIAQLDGLGPTARALGAVNTLVWEGDRLVGRNTDAPGWLADLRHRGMAIAGRKTVIVGTGGAGRAIAGAVLGAGVRELRLVNRTPSRAHTLVEELRPRFADATIEPAAWSSDSLADADLVVVATAGRPGSLDELDPSRCASGAVWCDLDYRSPEPPSSTRARAAGCHVVDGMGMLWWQAALAFEAWTGFVPDPQADPSTHGR
ncbi:MAG: shikimate dehydrogenase [Myxococcota bacterium]